jgi:excisionase family DNA binding protein
MYEQHARPLTEREAAERLRLSVATLRAWRLKSQGPRFVRFGRAVRYLEPDLDRFIQACVVETGGQPTPPLG